MSDSQSSTNNQDNNNQNEFADIPDIDSEDEDFVIEKEGEQPKDTIKRLREKLKEATAKKQEYLSGWQRAKADLVNAKKEFDRERKQIKRRGKEEIINDLLPALDSFAMAMADEEKWQSVDSEWRTGVEQIHEQLTTALGKHEVKKIAPDKGDTFDPQLHSSVDTRPAEGNHDDNTIAECRQAGYRIDQRVIRSAQVVVFSDDTTNTDKES